MYTLDQIKRAQQVSKDTGIYLEQAVVNIFNEDNEAKMVETKRIYDLVHRDTTKMSKQEIIDATWELPEMSESLYCMLRDQGGFKTGSTVIADITNAKDEDWCVQIPPSVFIECSLGQNNKGYWEADGFSAIYCHYKGKLLNIICFSDLALFKAWKFATDVMESLKFKEFETGFFKDTFKTNELFSTKWKRVILFRALKDIAYEPLRLRGMKVEDAKKYNKCCLCSREAIYFTCKAARDHYLETTVCERCAGIEY